jgi:hypothetical protein
VGTELPPDFDEKLPDNQPFPSGTAYGILTAIEKRQKGGELPDIYVFRFARGRGHDTTRAVDLWREAGRPGFALSAGRRCERVGEILAGSRRPGAAADDAGRHQGREIQGKEALDEDRHNFVDRYVENCAMLAGIIRVEADVKQTMATSKTVDEALAELESKVGTKGRRKFEKFFREVGELDDEDDVIDVESQ